MADGDPEKTQPSLELPKLGRRRRRRRATERGPEPVQEPVQEPLQEPVQEPLPETSGEATTEPAPEPAVEETRPILLTDPRPGAEPAPEPTTAAEEEPRRKAPRERKPGGMPAAVAGGLVVGLGIVGLTWASLRSCEAVQGTPSCGKAGYPMLTLIVAVMVVVGALLLRLLRVRDPGSTSFLGVGLAIVVALLVLVDHLMDRSMLVVIPVLTAATFALAHWVTRTFIEPARD